MHNQPIPSSAIHRKAAFYPALHSGNEPKTKTKIQKRTRDIALFDIKRRKSGAEWQPNPANPARVGAANAIAVVI